MAKMSLKPKSMTKAAAMKRAEHLGIKGIHTMPDGKFHPGTSHESMVRAIKKHNLTIGKKK